MAPEITNHEREMLDKIIERAATPSPGQACLDMAFLAQFVKRIIGALESEDDYQTEQRERP